jgi:hypothetical protein
MNRRTILSLALLCVAPLFCARAQEGIVGKWSFTLDTPGGDRQAEAVFELDGEKVKGKWGASDVKGTFVDGKLELEFDFTSEEVGATAPIKISGKLESGAITGNWAFTEYNGTFKAVRPK